MFASPIAWADDDHGRGGGDRGRGRGEGEGEGRVTVLVQSPAQTVVQRRDDDDEERGEEREERVVVLAATPLVNAINNEVANLMNRDVEVEDEDEDEVEVDEDEVEEVEDVDFDRVTLISLGTLESRVSDPSSAVRTAVNNNRDALLNFLNTRPALANAIRTAIRTAGINDDLNSLQAVLLGRGHRLIVVTS